MSQDFFSYNPGDGQLPEGHFKISPSRLSRFFDDTSNWYRECLLGEDPVFQGSTSSVLGTCVHGLASMYTITGAYDLAKAEEYIDSCGVEGIDRDFIRNQYPVMAQALVDQYTSKVKGRSELFLHAEILPGVSAGGSLDLLTDDTVVDYKTTSSLNAPTSIKREYYFQQLVYVWLARKAGYNIKAFELVYVTTNEVGRISETTGKPMKDYPTTVTPIRHVVKDEEIVMIENILRLVAESVITWKNQPELRHLLAQDMRLKVPQKRKIFTKD